MNTGVIILPCVDLKRQPGTGGVIESVDLPTYQRSNVAFDEYLGFIAGRQ
jgi:hypothetical protein